MHRQTFLKLLPAIILFLALIAFLRWSTRDVVPSSEDEDTGKTSLVLIAPNGGEQLCLGEATQIRWQAPKDMNTVELRLRERGVDDTERLIGNFPASFSETGETDGVGAFPWKVGEVFAGVEDLTTFAKEGSAYEMVISGKYGYRNLEDVSDKVFSILNCSEASE